MVYGGTVKGHAYWRNSANSYAIWNDSDSGKYEDWIFGRWQSCKITENSEKSS